MKTFRLIQIGSLVLVLGAFGIYALVQGQSLDPGSRLGRRNEQLYGFHGRITGKVTFDDGKPAAGREVECRFQMHQSGAPGEGYAVTRSDGTYEIRGLNPQRFYVSVGNENTGYIATPPVLVNLRHEITGLNFVLKPGPDLTIRVRDAETGAPVPNLRVQVEEQLPHNGPILGVTDAKGEYHRRLSFTAIRCTLSDPDGQHPHAAAPGSSFQNTFTSTQRAKVVWDVLAYADGYQQKPREWHGTVVDEHGAPVRDAIVRTPTNQQWSQTRTSSDGAFTISAIRWPSVSPNPGPQNVLFNISVGEKQFTLRVPVQDTWKPLRLQLQSQDDAALFGRVVDPSDQPIAGCDVECVASVRETLGAPSSRDLHTLTDDQGRFRFPRLNTAADYIVTLGPNSSRGQVGTLRIPKSLNGATWLHATRAGTDLGKLVIPLADRELSGQVVDEKGAPLSKDITVVVTGEHTLQYAEIAPNGKFIMRSLPKERLMVSVFSSHDGGTRTGSDSPDRLLDRAVTANEKSIFLRVKFRPAQP